MISGRLFHSGDADKMVNWAHMATENLDIIIRADSSDAVKDIGAVEGKMSGLSKIAGVAAVGAASVGASLIAFGKASIDAASALEQQEVAFKTLLGSQEKAVAFLGDVQKFAAKTPFETTDITQAAQTMLAFGADVKSVMPNIQMIGDVALGNKEKFASLSLAFSQVQATGKLMGQDLMQMVNQGFNPLQIMAEKSGKSMAELKDEMSAGKITSEMVTQAFKDATSEGGRFYGGMAAQSTTFAGLVSTLSDAWTTFLQGSGKLLIEWAKALVTQLTTLIQNVLPVVVEKIDLLMKKFAEFMPSGEGVMAFFGSLGVAVKDAATKFEQQTGIVAQLKDAFGRLWETIQNSLMPALAKLWEAMQPLMPVFEAFGKFLAAVLIVSLKILIEVLTIVAQWLIEIVAKLAEFSAEVLNNMKPGIEALTVVFNKVGEAIQWVIGKFNGMKDAAYAALAAAQSALSKIPGIGGLVGAPPGKADGGAVTAGKTYMVGERGPELFVPGSSGSIVPNHELGGAMSVSILEGANVSVRSDADIRAIADMVSTQLARTMQAQRNGLASAL